jgi:hypothetical protein
MQGHAPRLAKINVPKTFQIAIPPAEELRLINRIEQDFLSAKASHGERSERFARYMQKWENRVSPPRKGDENKPNHTVPLVQWQTFNKMARDLQALIGDDAEITARPTGPSDADKAPKVGRYMTSRIFDQMELLNPLAVFQFRRILFGRSIAYRPWYKREFDTLDDNGRKTRVCDYEGPGFFPLEPDDILTAAERGVQSIQDFSYVIRRVPVTVDELQYGDGSLYQGTSDPEFVKSAINWCKTGNNDYTLGQDPVRIEKERTEQVEYDAVNQPARRTLWLWEWYGKWRPLKRQAAAPDPQALGDNPAPETQVEFAADGAQDDLEKREQYEADWVVRYLPGMKKIVGCQDLLELYPKMRKRRPFVESSLVKDGSYWGKGFGQLLESIEDEATSNSRLFTAAGELSVWPIIFYKPGGGMNPKTMRVEPGMAIPTEDPASVRVVELRPNLDYAIQKNQDTIANGERVTGITDQSLGRSMQEATAPRTATGQLALIEEGNVRAYLDSTVLREDMEQIIADIWALDCDLAPKVEPGIWFRVTEATAQGTAGFDTAKGGAYMTPKEFAGRYDFRLKFATSSWSREAQAQKQLSFFQLAIQIPIVMQNARAQWVLLNKTAKALGIQDFNNVIPEPPNLDVPKTPDQEWTAMLEGDDEVQPNPADQDDVHLMKHMKQLAEAKKDPDPDQQAIKLLIIHIQQTREQKAAKMAMQALTQDLIRSIQPGNGGPELPQLMQAQAMGEQGGLPQGQPGQPGAPPGPPGAPPPQAPPQGPPPGGMPMPTSQVGSSAAPVAQDGML